jgi:hypothetical protein
MITILLIVPMSIGKKMMIGGRRSRTTRKTRIIRRRPMVRHTLVRSETPMMRALTPIVVVWPP